MTLENADIPSADSAPKTPTNQPHLYRALLHKDSMTLENVDVPSANEIPPHTPKCTEPYYTRTLT